MTEQERKELIALVESLIEELSGDLAALKKSNQPISPDRAIGRLSRLEAMNDKSVREATMRKIEDRLSRLKEARERVKSDGFGLCESCEEPIEMKRLRLVPESRVCMGCLRGA